MSMPRISLYKPEKGLDYSFMDRQISEMFQVGGTDVYLHKYLGPKNPTEGTADQPIYGEMSPTNIQDMLFLENRDRKYATEVYRIRGIYNVQNIDFNLSQFGLFIENDTIYMTVHINDFIEYIGRKPISGDVIELPHLRDDFAFNSSDVTLPRYYVIDDVGRASEGFSPTWYPHLYRLKLKKITGSQQYADILNQPVGEDLDRFMGDYDPTVTYQPGDIVRYEGNLYTVTQTTTGNTPPNGTYYEAYAGTTADNLLSTRAKEMEINNAILQQAEADAPLSGYETRQFYTLAVDATGKPVLSTADDSVLDASTISRNASMENARPLKTGYTGYLVGDGFPVNGYEFGHGIQFPESAYENDFFLRTDFYPNRLFRFNGTRWIRIEDAVRMELTNTNTRATQKFEFINNDKFIYNDVIGTDEIRLTEGDFVIYTNIDYVQALYVVFKVAVLELSFAVEDYASLIEMYTNNDNVEKVKINLPIINNEQVTIPETGLWNVKLANNREAQKQSLSKALRPKADL